MQPSSRFSQLVKGALRGRPILWSTLKLVQGGAYQKAFNGVCAGLSRHGVVVSSNDLGVSNRIKCLMSSMRLARLLNRQVAVFWPRNWACRCDFQDLFENKFFELDVESMARLRESAADDRTLLLDTWGSLLCLPGDAPQSAAETTDDVVVPVLDFEYGNTPVEIREAYLRHVLELRPNAHIRREVQQYSQRFGRSTISVSIRSWVEAKERAQGLFNMQHVFDCLDRHEGAEFFVSCDSNDVLEALIRRYGSRVLHYPKRTGTNDRRSREGMQDILVDMLLLSRNPILVASYLSTYPEVAWWLGGCKATTELIEPPDRIAEWKARHQRAINEKVGHEIRRLHRLVQSSKRLTTPLSPQD